MKINYTFDADKPFIIEIIGFKAKLKAIIGILLYGMFEIAPPYDLHREKKLKE